MKKLWDIFQEAGGLTIWQHLWSHGSYPQTSKPSTDMDCGSPEKARSGDPWRTGSYTVELKRLSEINGKSSPDHVFGIVAGELVTFVSCCKEYYLTLGPIYKVPTFLWKHHQHEAL